MPLVVKDRVLETSTTTGTGTLTLAGASTGYQTFSSAIGNGNTTYYAISLNGEWEVGIGTVGAGTLSRDTVLESSNAGSLVNFSAGAKQVFCTYPAEKSVDIDTAQTLTNKTISVDNNTISGIAASSFVLSNSSGNIDGAIAQKSIPSGTVVGTSDSQTLTNKTLTNPVINGFTGDTSVVNIGSGQLYKDTSGNVGIGTASPSAPLHIKGYQYLEDGGGNLVMFSNGTGGSIIFRKGIASSYTDVFYTDSASQFFANSGYGSAGKAYFCRAWVNFNGSGTVAIRGSANVTSITDNGTGTYTVNLTTAMPDTNGAVAVGGAFDTPIANHINGINAIFASSSTISINTFNTSTGGDHDSVYTNVSVFR